METYSEDIRMKWMAVEVEPKGDSVEKATVAI